MSATTLLGKKRASVKNLCIALVLSSYISSGGFAAAQEYQSDPLKPRTAPATPCELTNACYGQSPNSGENPNNGDPTGGIAPKVIQIPAQVQAWLEEWKKKHWPPSTPSPLPDPDNEKPPQSAWVPILEGVLVVIEGGDWVDAEIHSAGKGFKKIGTHIGHGFGNIYDDIRGKRDGVSQQGTRVSTGDGYATSFSGTAENGEGDSVRYSGTRTGGTISGSYSGESPGSFTGTINRSGAVRGIFTEGSSSGTFNGRATPALDHVIGTSACTKNCD